MLTIYVDERRLNRLLKNWPGQARFATSLAINKTLERAQADERKHMHSVFTIRNRRFMDYAVKLKPKATKSRLEGILRIDPPGGQARADVITKFEEGGTKRPTHGRQHLAIPGRQVKRGARGVPKRLRPAAAIDAGIAFVARTRRGTPAIFQRLGVGKRTRLRYLYSLVTRAKVDDRLEFIKTGEASITRHGETELFRAWAHAVATAR